MKKLLQLFLDCLARLYLWRFRPEIIAVTGNVGKTSTKEAIACVLGRIKKVRSSKGNLNNEFGVPLTIIGDWADKYYETGNSIQFWFKVLVAGCWSLAVGQNYPQVLVLEYGADRPGDIARLVKKYKPKIGIVTAIGEIPVHVEYFSDSNSVAREKSKLISALKPSDYAILNHDDPAVYDMKEKTKAKIMSYGFTPSMKTEDDIAKSKQLSRVGFGEEAMIQLSNFDFRFDKNGKPDGVGFKVHHGANTFVPFNIHGSLGKSQALAAGAAVCVGAIYEMNLIEIGEALADYRGPNGRLKILKGIKNSTIIDDTYNAAPASTHLALETLKELSVLSAGAGGGARRKVVVLGDMLELGKYSIEAHEEIGNLAGSIADILVTVGLRGKFIAYAAENQLAPSAVEGMPQQRIFSFPTSNSAKSKVQELIREGDLILVKGSQGIRMEKIIEEIMAEPERKKELLVRQSKQWLAKP